VRAAPGSLTGLGGQLLLLAALAQTVGLGRAGWVVGAASGYPRRGARTRSVAQLRSEAWPGRLGDPHRATLAVGVAALTASSFERDAAVATLVALASLALALDFVDDGSHGAPTRRRRWARGWTARSMPS